MNLAVSIARWFRYGGLQRDCRAVLEEWAGRGHRATLFTLHAEDPPPPGVNLEPLPVRGLTNHARLLRFARDLERRTAAFDLHLGFDKLPGLDVYFAGDSCLRHKLETQRTPLHRLLPRYRTLLGMERRVFSDPDGPLLLMVSKSEARHFQRLYGTPCERMRLLPPGIASDRAAGPDAPVRRAAVRAKLGVGDAPVFLFVGSGFRKKGLDRAIRGLATLDGAQLLVAGEDREAAYRRLARRLGIADRVHFLGGRDDIPDLLLAADLLVHPARDEAGGVVLLEALASGLPVATTALCGHAEEVGAAGAGVVLPEPFDQAAWNAALARLLAGNALPALGAAGRAYAEAHDLHGRARAVADAVEGWAP